MESNVESSTKKSTAFKLVDLLLNEINQQDINGLLNIQQALLDDLDKTNEKLDSINKVSAQRFLNAKRDFDAHTRVLINMKSDLELISKRIRTLQTRLSRKYPTEYSAVRQSADQKKIVEDDDDEDILSSPLTENF